MRPWLLGRQAPARTAQTPYFQVMACPSLRQVAVVAVVASTKQAVPEDPAAAAGTTEEADLLAPTADRGHSTPTVAVRVSLCWCRGVVSLAVAVALDLLDSMEWRPLRRLPASVATVVQVDHGWTATPTPEEEAAVRAMEELAVRRSDLVASEVAATLASETFSPQKMAIQIRVAEAAELWTRLLALAAPAW